MKFTDLFSPELVIYDMQVEDSNELLRNIADHLQERGYVEEGYCQMLLDREKSFPTGIDTELFNIALPHTDPKHVIKPCIIIVKVKTPVVFGLMGGGDDVAVDYAFGLVLKKMDGQIELLQQVMEIVTNTETMRKLQNATSADDIVNALYEYNDLSSVQAV